jgi:uncharacterized membrane protein
MKTAFYLIVTCLVSTGALMSALNMKDPFPAFAVAFGIWALFLWGCARRYRKIAEKRSRERLFEEYMRSKLGNDQR